MSAKFICKSNRSVGRGYPTSGIADPHSPIPNQPTNHSTPPNKHNTNQSPGASPSQGAQRKRVGQHGDVSTVAVMLAALCIVEGPHAPCSRVRSRRQISATRKCTLLRTVVNQQRRTEQRGLAYMCMNPALARVWRGMEHGDDPSISPGARVRCALLRVHTPRRVRGCVPTVRLQQHASVHWSGWWSSSRDGLSSGAQPTCA